MNRTSGGIGYAIGDGAVAERRDVKTADPGVLCSHESRCQIGQPVRIWVRIIIDIGDNVPDSGLQTYVARSGEASILSADKMNLMLFHYEAGVIR